jgi:hypothetical protein
MIWPLPRPIKTLQIAVDDECKVVEPFAGRERKCSDRLRFVHLAVAENAPDMTIIVLRQGTIPKISQKSRLIDRIDGAESHGPGRKLPEIRHKPGMRIRA